MKMQIEKKENTQTNTEFVENTRSVQEKEVIRYVIQTEKSYLPSIYQSIKICAMILLIIMSFGVYRDVIVPILEMPNVLKEKFDGYWNDANSVLNSMNFFSMFDGWFNNFDVDVEHKFHLMESLKQASSTLNDIPLSNNDFPSKEVEENVEAFTVRIRGLAKDLWNAYKITQTVFIQSSAFMTNGVGLVSSIKASALQKRNNDVAAGLQELLIEAHRLKEAHEDADKELQSVHDTVNELSSVGKASVDEYHSASLNVEGWNELGKRISTLYIPIIGLIAMPAGLPVGMSIGASFAFMEWVNGYQQRVEASQYGSLARNFNLAYAALSRTREIIQRDIEVLTRFSNHLQQLITHVTEFGIQIDDRYKFETSMDKLKSRLQNLHLQYEALIDEDSEEKTYPMRQI